MSAPVGITVPKLLPITGTFAPLFATYFAVLNLRVGSLRIKNNKSIGLPSDASNPAVGPDELTIASRCQGNFVENVPLALLLGAVVELNGGNRKALTGGLSLLLLARILHSEFGLRTQNNMGIGRPLGFFGSLGFITGAAGYAAYLVKGYWGF